MSLSRVTKKDRHGEEQLNSRGSSNVPYLGSRRHRSTVEGAKGSSIRQPMPRVISGTDSFGSSLQESALSLSWLAMVERHG